MEGVGQSAQQQEVRSVARKWRWSGGVVEMAMQCAAANAANLEKVTFFNLKPYNGCGAPPVFFVLLAFYIFRHAKQTDDVKIDVASA